MITLHSLEWDNFLSYGENNVLELDKYPLVGLVGENGAGKTSIAVALEELFTGKNHRNFKKSELLNRKSSANTLRIACSFSKDSDHFYLEQRRTSTKTSILLKKNDEDISSHRVTDTYKTLEKIFGMSGNLLAKLLYQSSKQSLEFLTTTDAKRKEFLVKFLNLEVYSEYSKKTKEKLKEIDKDIRNIEKLYAYTLARAETEIDEPMAYLNVPEVSVEALEKEQQKLNEKKAEATAKLNQIKSAKTQYLKKKKERDTLSVKSVPQVDEPEYLAENEVTIENPSSELKTAKSSVLATKNRIKEIETALDNTKDENACAVCGKLLLEAKDAEESVEALKVELKEKTDSLVKLEKEVKILENRKKEYDDQKAEYDQAVKENTKRKEKYIQALKEREKTIEKNKNTEAKLAQLEQELLELEQTQSASTDDLSQSIKDIEEKLSKISKDLSQYNQAIAHNKLAEEVNRKIEEKTQAREKAVLELKEMEEELAKLQDSVSVGEILEKSLKGLIGYKIEESAHGLEKLTNKYLEDFSDGRFRIQIRVKGEKLPITVFDYGEAVGIHTLSQGELSWVNISTLLAIRGFLSNIAGSTINFLMLDELSGVLDENSNEKLVNILLQEPELNTFIVSHNYNHPLIVNKLIEKSDEGISRIL